MTAVEQNRHQGAVDAAAQVAYPGGGKVMWAPPFHIPAVPVHITAAPKWSVRRCADLLSVEPFPTDDWRPHAACKDVGPDLWFPERGEDDRNARAICHQCPVRAECLSVAMNDPYMVGTWGGVSFKQRKEIRNGRRYNLNARRGRPGAA
jgi:WhiB family redox-sensing transcriptional regulator